MANGFLLQLAMPLNWLGTMYSESRRSLVDFQSMVSVLKDPMIQPQALPGATPIFASEAEVRPLSVSFEGIGFKYPAAASSDALLFQDVSVHINAGGMLGIVGTSGSGKSSLFRLLLRFYDPLEGCIKVNGRDIRGIELNCLRNAIGVIPQDVVLFNKTLLENVRFGNPDASEEEVLTAIRGASLDTVAEALPQGLQTRVGERGLKLSGGEKQRVAIARALLKRPSLLLIDEGTASLDSNTEKDVLRHIDTLSVEQSCTKIVIAHRLSTLQGADKICVLNEGTVSEIGSHAELLQSGGLYANLWQQQQKVAT